MRWGALRKRQYSYSTSIIGLLQFFSYLIILNTLVPISLYVRCVCLSCDVQR